MVATGSGALGASQDRMLIGAGSDADRRAKLLIHLAAERSLLDAYSHAGLVNEVKACTIYCRAGMVELIEMALLCPTVTSGAPVGDQVSKISRFNSVGPSGDPYVRWQTGVCQTISKIIQHVHRNRDLEGFAHIHSWNAHLSNCGIHGSVPDREPGLKGASPPIGCPPSISLLSSSRQSPRGRRKLAFSVTVTVPLWLVWCVSARYPYC